MQETNPTTVKYLSQYYESASKGNYDIYVVFVERALSLLNEKGRFGYILPHKFFNSQYGEPLREVLAKGSHVTHVVHFGDQQVFDGATTYTCLLFLAKAGSKNCQVVKINYLMIGVIQGKQMRGKFHQKLSQRPCGTFLLVREQNFRKDESVAD